ncbi:hypothetical protein H5P28_14070 [Ruficoccus amylovorans]|uniref:Uncharacterized protein n=1 Tax=Ruficoccus amylovorans TaxID=1804625 RepID=A0A842HGT4_9BACT|nr:hypothetical protein [Ruficoccus amylovorans]MBC2595390.1 hypothetical protein [Ruficoccus amylovorans]
MTTLRNRLLALSLIVGSLFLAACQPPQVQYYPLNNPVGTGTPTAAPSAPIDPADVVIYVAKQPAQPYHELGIMTYTSASSQPNEGNIYQMFRVKAAELGADAVIVLPSREQNESFWQTTGYPYDWYYGYGYGGGVGYSSGYSTDYTTFRALAIQYTHNK